MEFEIIEETPKKLVFDLKGQSHTLCNGLKSKLWLNKHIKTATYSISHPLVGIPRMIVETDGEQKPRKALSEAASLLKKEVSELNGELKKFRW
jgi:DNA-directed RNA polymerase subunit L